MEVEAKSNEDKQIRAEFGMALLGKYMDILQPEVFLDVAPCYRSDHQTTVGVPWQSS